MKKQLNDKEWENIARYLGDELSTDEKARFDEWVSGSEENRNELESIKKVWANSNTDGAEEFHENDSWSRLRNRMKDHSVTTYHTKTLFTSFLKIAASFILLVGIGYAVFSLFHASQVNTIVARNEKILSPVLLPDGTKVYLNVGARLEYPKAFEGTTRQVSLTGEAFFEVTRNVKMPFVVKTSKAMIKVLGTSFNVLAEEKTDSIQVVVETGTVELAPIAESQKIKLSRGNTGAYYIRTHQLDKRSVSDINTTAWKTNIIVFHDADLQYITKTLSKLFHQQIQLTDERLKKCRMNSDFKHSNLESILNTIHTLLGVTIEKTTKGYLISGPGC